jgi:6-pyruvoyltetrahydropterin/6-carboxytetrahydropterin synthase
LYELTVEAQFDAAHNLRKYDGPCESLHGHTYKVHVSYAGTELNDLGMLVDFKLLKNTLGDVVDYMDHKYLNELPEFLEENPTAEHISRYIFSRMREALGEGISKVTVWETPTASATYSE